jgi:hypothetical protein
MGRTARVALTRPRQAGAGFWLLARRRLSDGELAFYACFGPTRTTLAELVAVAGCAGRAVEGCVQAAKDKVGLDDYQWQERQATPSGFLTGTDANVISCLQSPGRTP